MNTKLEQTRRNLEQVKIAITTLKENEQRLSVKAISDLTGISVPTLYNYEMVRAFVKPTERRKKLTVEPIHSIQDSVAHDVDGYASYINEHYFHHTEEVEDALQDMMLNVRNFRASVFQQAVNKLKAAGAILELPNQPGFFNRGMTDTRPRAQAKPEVKDEQPSLMVKLELKAEQLDGPSIERLYQLPLSSGKSFIMTIPSKISQEDCDLIADFFQLIQARTLKSKTRGA